MICIENYQYDDYFVMRDCLTKYGRGDLAKELLTSTKVGFFDECLAILTKEATARFDNDVMQRLFFSGLIYDMEIAECQ